MMLFGSLALPPKAIRSLPRRRDWTYASHDVIEGPQKAQFVSAGAGDLSLQLFLHADFCDPKEIIEALVMMADSAGVHVLQSESGVVHGQYVIESVNDDPRWTLPDGTLLVATVDVGLRDPGIDEVLALARPKPIATADAATDTQAEPPPEDRSRAPDEVTPEEIARL